MEKQKHYEVGRTEPSPSLVEKRERVYMKYSEACKVADDHYKQSSREAYVYSDGDCYYRYKVNSEGHVCKMYPKK